eukprot:m.179485 g.179485  ORF g.179485 m.179485 type:complete len:326 (-) comp53425_c0_seq2:1296-2273(-)
MDDFSTSSEQYQTHLYRARALVVCPASIRFNSDSEQHVVLAFIYALQLTLAALFALFTYSRFNSVAIFTRSVRTSTISNIMWLYFFLAICVHGLVACVRYVASVVQQRDSQNANQVDKSLFTLQTLTETAASLLLCYALFHQYMHRSSNTQPVYSVGSNNADTQAFFNAERETLQSKWSAFFSLLFLGSSTFGLLEIWDGNGTSALYYYLYLGFRWSQFAVASGLTGLIVLSRLAVGPPTRSKNILAVGVVLYLVNVLPAEVWQYYVNQGCTFYVASTTDALVLISIISLFFLFIFLRQEFIRNKDATIYTTIAHIEDSMRFKAF